MGIMLRLILFAVLLYLVVKLLRSFMSGGDRRVSGTPKTEIRPSMEGTEIIDAKFTEIPPEKDKSTS